MGQTQEYLKNKKIKEMNLPKMYLVTSSPDKVSRPLEVEVNEIKYGNTKGFRYEGNELCDYISDTYVVTMHGNITIEHGKTNYIKNGYSSGIGDLWKWTQFFSLSLEEAENYYEKELERVHEKYTEPFLKEKYRILTKYDLTKEKKDADLEDIDLFFFKTSSITIKEIEEAYFIIYVDENKRKILKDRFN